jgi:SAM-dependent methyltransferase
MNLVKIQRSWEALGKKNPIPAMPPYMSRQIRSLDELYTFGKNETDDLITYIRQLNLPLQLKRAVDFGCGVGRISQALATHFELVYGVDIAPSLLNIAERYNCYPDRCHYLLNETSDLSVFDADSVDFIWCYGTLQVLKPRYFREYVNEFLRILVPGGVVVILHAARPTMTAKGLVLRMTPSVLVNSYRRFRYRFEIHPMRRHDVIRTIQRAGGTIVDIREDCRTPGRHWHAYQYCVIKR